MFTQRSGDNSYIPIQVTEEKTTRSIIVRGKENDLDVVNTLIREIDVRTKQVLIEAFIVEANSDFERALSKSEFASTINASIKTCLVLTSISLIRVLTTSKSFSLPLTIIDLVVFSSVT